MRDDDILPPDVRGHRQGEIYTSGGEFSNYFHVILLRLRGRRCSQRLINKDLRIPVTQALARAIQASKTVRKLLVFEAARQDY